MPSFAAFRLGRMAAAIETGFTEHFLPEFLNEVRLMEAVDLDRFSIEELVGHFETMQHRFITRTYVQAEIVNIAASFYLDRAKSALERRGLSPAIYLSDIPETVTSREVAALGKFDEPEKRLASFLDTFGHRARLDYELACPRYREDPKVAEFIMNNWCAAGRDRAATALTTPAIRNWRDKSLATLVTRTRRFETLKEDAKHYCLRELALLRRTLTAIDHRLSMDGDIFYLTLGEVYRLAEREFRNEARALAQRRQADHELFQRLPAIPAELSVARIETMTVGEEGPMAEASDGPLRGTLVAGSEAVIGPARVISAPDAEIGVGLDQLEDGEIVVSRLIHPHWLVYFPRARGLICEVGGWLSHAAILAREYNVPMIVGVHGIDSIRTGDLLKLNTDGSIERIGGGQSPTMPGPVSPRPKSQPTQITARAV